MALVRSSVVAFCALTQLSRTPCIVSSHPHPVRKSTSRCGSSTLTKNSAHRYSGQRRGRTGQVHMRLHVHRGGVGGRRLARDEASLDEEVVSVGRLCGWGDSRHAHDVHARLGVSLCSSLGYSRVLPALRSLQETSRAVSSTPAGTARGAQSLPCAQYAQV